MLNLSRNALPELRLPTSLSSLVALDLSHNRISRIDPAQLGDLPELQVCHLPSGASSTLDDIIDISIVPQVLDLQHNSLASLPALPRLPTLRALILSHNLLRWCDDDNNDDNNRNADINAPIYQFQGAPLPPSASLPCLPLSRSQQVQIFFSCCHHH